MPTCKDCINFRSRDTLGGHCAAAEDKTVEADRDSADCIAAAFESKEEDKDMV